AIRIKTVLLCCSAYELHRCEHILDRLGKALLPGLGEPVTHGKKRIAAFSEIRPPILKGRARALHPAPAVHCDEHRKRSIARRQIEIPLQSNAVMGRIGHTRTDIHFFRCPHECRSCVSTSSAWPKPPLPVPRADLSPRVFPAAEETILVVV